MLARLGLSDLLRTAPGPAAALMQEEAAPASVTAAYSAAAAAEGQLGAARLRHLYSFVPSKYKFFTRSFGFLMHCSYD